MDSFSCHSVCQIRHVHITIIQTESNFDMIQLFTKYIGRQGKGESKKSCF